MENQPPTPQAPAAPAAPLSQEEIEERIAEVIDADIRPGLRMDGGDCEFIGFDEGVVRLKLQGACSSCSSSTMTLQFGIEKRLKEQFPQVQAVVSV